MSTITYKCPNCDADLTYRPATGDFGCEYCGSSYTGEQLNELIKNQKIIDEQKESEGTAFDEHAVVYTCPNCGAEVITDDTTAATFCFYCHNPVILKGRLSGGMAPDKVIPFSIPKEKVKEQLISWCKSKKYIDDGFFSEMQLEKLTGVYFPFWLVDSDVRATMTAKSNSLKVMGGGRYRIHRDQRLRPDKERRRKAQRDHRKGAGPEGCGTAQRRIPL